MCFNTPYGRTVITNVAKKFLQLIDLHFPPSNKFHKIFNRNNVKVSYCCTQNVGNIIKSHNKKLVNSSNHHEQPCNCRKKEDCPFEGKCRTENIIYKCIVSTSGQPDQVYLGTARTPTLKWYIVKSVPSYSNIRKSCMSCLHEKFEILTYPNQDELLNKRSELVSKYCPINKYLLSNYKIND